MDESCKISVIIPVYNVEKYLHECLDSILCQDLDNFEIVCVEDCSTDNSMSILKDYATRYPMIRIVEYGCNKGQAYARNRGMEIAKGKYLYFMDSDDILCASDRLSLIYNRAEKEKLDVLLFDAYVVYEAKRLQGIYGEEKFTSRFEYPGIMEGTSYFSQCYRNGDFRCVVWQQLWNREFLLENTLFFDEDTSPHEDLLFTFKAMLQVKKLQYIREAVYTYRCREFSSTTTAFSIKRYMAYCRIYFYSMEYLKKNMFSKDAYDAIVEYLNDVKQFIKRGAVELIQNGADIYNAEFNEQWKELAVRQILVEDYPSQVRLLNCDEYRKIVSDKVIIYGVGYVGKDVVKMLNAFGIDDYKLAVTKKKAESDSINGKEIYELIELQNETENYVVIAVKKQNQDEMVSYAKELGFKKILLME